MSFSLDERFRKVGDLDVNEAPDGYVAYDHARAKVHFMNVTAASILELCDGHASVGAICTLIQEAFGLDEPPRADVNACLRDLVFNGLVESCNQS
jgi:hypothetical protein